MDDVVVESVGKEMADAQRAERKKKKRKGWEDFQFIYYFLGSVLRSREI